ncbi:MAG: cysteine--tRNA ligase [Hyphomicrobiales bacterium]
MTLKLYDTLTRKKREFEPIDANNVRLYVCGVTVYDFAHIGNARPMIVFDVLFRLLRHLYGDTHVTYARNITDVDDKINERAARDFPDLALNEAIRRVTEATTKQFHEDVAALGSLTPSVEPRATEHLEEMRDIIERLVEGGFAYVAEGHVLFSPAAMDAAAKNGTLPHYGALANRSLDEMLAGARIEVAPYKRDPMDFVLWKPSKPGEPGWPSPAGITVPGRPGWHIECSAMAWKHLGETFDIHGGGIDLVFPHHENEIAQSCAAFGRRLMANYWMHNGFLQVEAQKMSKSLGNFVTINELLTTEVFGGRKWPGAVLRLAMLMTNYRLPIDFTLSRLREADTRLRRMHLAYKTYEHVEPGGDIKRFLDFLKDDLNTDGALKELARLTHNALGVVGVSDEIAGEPNPPVGAEAAKRMLKAAHFIGLLAETPAQQRAMQISLVGVDETTVSELISQRKAARERKDWKESDRIRDELLAMGVTPKDNKDGTTTWEVKR